MECFIVTLDDVDSGGRRLFLRGDEARHALRSLRLQPGEKLFATDLRGTCYLCTLIGSREVGKNEFEAECAITETLADHHESARDVVLAQAILQQPSRFEEIVEKATELGVSGFIPLITKRTEKKQINRERIERILREATKQVSRARMPKIEDPVSIEDVLKTHKRPTMILLHESAPIEVSLSSLLTGSKNNILLFVGPEGGFTDEEVALAVNHGAVVASLGPRRLRAETAAVAAISLVSLQG